MQASAKGKSKQAKQVNVPTPHQALQALATCQLSAYVSEGALWLAAPLSVVNLLYECALGTSEGGPHTAQDTVSLINASLSGSSQEAPSELVSLRLSPEEAFFLKFAVGSLTAVTAVGTLSAQELWLICTRQKPTFAYTYVAYHHFRSKGWIPRSGLQYGANLVLYEQHPSLVHSTVCVLIVPVKEDNQTDISSCSTVAYVQDGHDGHLTWHCVEGINRLCTRVGKRLMLLYIQQQHAGADLTSPTCLNGFAVAEHNVERWVPEATVNLM